MEIRMSFYTLLFRGSYFVFFLILAGTSFSDASIILQSSAEISSPTFSPKSVLERRESSKNENKDCTTEMDRMSARLSLLEQQISLLNSKNEQQEKEINRMKALVDLKNSELEKCVSNISLPIDRGHSSSSAVSTLETIILEAKKPYGNCSFVENAIHCENVEFGDVKSFIQSTDLIDNNNPLRLINLTLLRGDEFIPADIFPYEKFPCYDHDVES